MTAIFVDTNVLIYAVDRRDAAKHDIAGRMLSCLGPESTYISSQVLSEYASVLTHPSKHALPPWNVIPDVVHMGAAWNVLPVNADTVVAALEARERWQLAYYDAQIWAAAALNAVPIVISEDFADGTSLEGVRFVNPFAEDFDIAQLS